MTNYYLISKMNAKTYLFGGEHSGGGVVEEGGGFEPAKETVIS